MRKTSKDPEARATNVFHTTDLATTAVFTNTEEKQRDQPREDSWTASVSEQGETTSTDIGHEET